jgi:hypothetical protein
MSKGHRTYLELALNGEALPEEIDDFVDAWHDGHEEEELHDFLGMTWEEYSLWLTNPDFLEIIIAARYNDQPLLNAVNDNVSNSNRLAARTDEPWKAALLRRWIDQQSRSRTRD